MRFDSAGSTFGVSEKFVLVLAFQAQRFPRAGPLQKPEAESARSVKSTRATVFADIHSVFRQANMESFNSDFSLHGLFFDDIQIPTSAGHQIPQGSQPAAPSAASITQPISDPSSLFSQYSFSQQLKLAPPPPPPPPPTYVQQWPVQHMPYLPPPPTQSLQSTHAHSMAVLGAAFHQMHGNQKAILEEVKNTARSLSMQQSVDTIAQDQRLTNLSQRLDESIDLIRECTLKFDSMPLTSVIEFINLMVQVGAFVPKSHSNVPVTSLNEPFRQYLIFTKRCGMSAERRMQALEDALMYAAEHNPTNLPSDHLALGFKITEEGYLALPDHELA